MIYSIFTIYIKQQLKKTILLFVRYLSPSQPLLRVYTWLKLYSDQHSLMYTIIYPIFFHVPPRQPSAPYLASTNFACCSGLEKALNKKQKKKKKRNSQSTLIMWKQLANKTVAVKLCPHRKRKKEEKNQTVVPGIPLILFLFDSLCIPKKIFPSI